MSNKEQPGYLAAREELTILERLHHSVWVAISRLSKRPNFDAETGEVDLAIHDARQKELKGYKELADHCYGRTVIGTKVDEEKHLAHPFSYRITQANIGSLDCGVLSRNSPVATKLVAAQLNEEVEDNLEGTRYFKIEETRVFEGPTSLHLSDQQPDFRSMLLRQADRLDPVLILGLRSFVEGEVPTLTEVVKVEPPEVLKDPTWIDDWSRIYLPDSETQSLSHQFFTQTTRAQEDVLNDPRGLTLVEGIAGAGKTSVALGRLKFFANFETGENREHYRLQDANESDFSPAGMVGFVLSHSLKRYLKDTAAELDLERLPIRDFQEFRTHLSNRFGLSRLFKRREAKVSPYRTRLEWLRAIDAAAAQVAGSKLEDVISKAANIPAFVSEVVRNIAADIKGAEPKPNEPLFYLMGLAQRLVTDVMQAEYRAREESIRSRQHGRDFLDRFELERELRQSRMAEERGVITPIARRLLDVLTAQDLIVDAVHLQNYPELVRRAFVNSVEENIGALLDSCIVEARDSFTYKKEGERLALTDADLLVVIASAAMIADGFEHPNAPGHLFKVRRNICVFIDEVQDFTEIEVFLMGMTVSSKYHQITLSGDLCQRLRWNGSKNYQNLFPSIPKSSQNTSIFWNETLGSAKLWLC
jgi:hypothetical protein